MKHKTIKSSPLFFMVDMFYIFAWVLKLANTDSIYSVYILCSVIGVFCACDAYRTNYSFSNAQKITVWLLSFGFSVIIILANYLLVSDVYAPFFWLDLFFRFVGGAVLAKCILSTLLFRAPHSVVTAERNHAVLWFLSSFASITGIYLLYLFTAAYPGVLTLDSVGSISEMKSGDYSNTLPFVYTMTINLLYMLGEKLFHDPNAAVALFSVAQVLFLSACYAYVITTLYQRGTPMLYCVGVYVFFLLIPYNIVYSITMWKDVLFSAGAVLLVTAMYRILDGICGIRKLDYFLFAIGCTGFSLWRSNGFYAFCVIAIVFCLFF